MDITLTFSSPMLFCYNRNIKRKSGIFVFPSDLIKLMKYTKKKTNLNDLLVQLSYDNLEIWENVFELVEALDYVEFTRKIYKTSNPIATICKLFGINFPRGKYASEELLAALEKRHMDYLLDIAGIGNQLYPIRRRILKLLLPSRTLLRSWILFFLAGRVFFMLEDEEPIRKAWHGTYCGTWAWYHLSKKL